MTLSILGGFSRQCCVYDIFIVPEQQTEGPRVTMFPSTLLPPEEFHKKVVCGCPREPSWRGISCALLTVSGLLFASTVKEQTRTMKEAGEGPVSSEEGTELYCDG